MKDKPLFVVGYFDLDDLDLDEKSPQKTYGMMQACTAKCLGTFFLTHAYRESFESVSIITLFKMIETHDIISLLLYLGSSKN